MAPSTVVGIHSKSRKSPTLRRSPTASVTPRSALRLSRSGRGRRYLIPICGHSRNGVLCQRHPDDVDQARRATRGIDHASSPSPCEVRQGWGETRFGRVKRLLRQPSGFEGLVDRRCRPPANELAVADRGPPRSDGRAREDWTPPAGDTICVAGSNPRDGAVSVPGWCYRSSARPRHAARPGSARGAAGSAGPSRRGTTRPKYSTAAPRGTPASRRPRQPIGLYARPDAALTERHGQERTSPRSPATTCCSLPSIRRRPGQPEQHQLVAEQGGVRAKEKPAPHLARPPANRLARRTGSRFGAGGRRLAAATPPASGTAAARRSRIGPGLRPGHRLEGPLTRGRERSSRVMLVTYETAVLTSG